MRSSFLKGVVDLYNAASLLLRLIARWVDILAILLGVYDHDEPGIAIILHLRIEVYKVARVPFYICLNEQHIVCGHHGHEVHDA